MYTVTADLRGLRAYSAHTDTHAHTHTQTDKSSNMYKIKRLNSFPRIKGASASPIP